MNWGRQLFAAASYLRWCVQKRSKQKLIVPPVPTVKRMGCLPTWHTTSLGGLVKRSSRNLGDMRVKDAASYLRWCVQKRNGTLRNLIAPPVPTVKRMGSLPTLHTP